MSMEEAGILEQLQEPQFKASKSDRILLEYIRTHEITMVKYSTEKMKYYCIFYRAMLYLICLNRRIYMSRYVCIDIGGTAVKYGLADEQGKLLDKGSMETRAQEGPQPLLEHIRELAAAYQSQQPVAGIAVSTAGIVDPEKGSILFAGDNLPGYTGTDVKAILERDCGVLCEVENDVNCAGLGELWLGAGRGAKSLVCITVGTGIGGCVILDGRLVHGRHHRFPHPVR